MKQIKRKTLEFLKKGMNPPGIALAVSLGIIMGLFPIYGPISLLVLGLAVLLRLNVPLVFSGYYSMTFVKPALIIPFLRLGEFLFGSEPMTISLVELTRRFSANAPETLAEFGWSFVHAMAGWAVMIPVLALLLYPVTFLLACRWRSGLQAKAVLPLLLVALIFFAPSSSEAWPFSSEDKKEKFPGVLTVHGETLKLNGVGVLRYKRIVAVYDAALYRGEQGAQRLDVVYRVNAKAAQFEEAGENVLARNYSSDDLEPLQARLDQINAWYPDPQKGDRCAITYLPGKGTELTFNGESLGVIPGEDFASVYFSIWLGEDPACPRLRKQLLSDNS